MFWRRKGKPELGEAAEPTAAFPAITAHGSRKALSPKTADSPTPARRPRREALDIYSLGRKKWAANLFWQAIGREAGTSITAMLNFARKRSMALGGHLYALRRGKTPQFGTGWTDQDVSQFALKTRALALDVADAFRTKATSWIAVFEAGKDRFYLLAVIGGNIHPIHDLLGDKDTVVSQLAEALDEANLKTWQKIHVPASWQSAVADADDVPTPSLEALLGKAQSKNGARLIAVKIRLKKSTLAAAAIAIMALGGGIYAVYEYQAEQERVAQEAAMRAARENRARREAAAREAAARDAASREASQRNQPPPPPPVETPKPWSNHADPIDILRACAAAARDIPASIGGWTIVSTRCGGGTIAMSLRASQRSSTSNLLVELPLATIDAAGTGASFARSIAWPSPPQAEREADFLPLEAEKSRLTDLARRLEARLTMTPLPTPIPPQPGQPPPPPQEWRGETFVINSGLPLLALEPLFRRPGLRITAVNRNYLPPGNWTIDGILYAR